MWLELAKNSGARAERSSWRRVARTHAGPQGQRRFSILIAFPQAGLDRRQFRRGADGQAVSPAAESALLGMPYLYFKRDGFCGMDSVTGPPWILPAVVDYTHLRPTSSDGGLLALMVHCRRTPGLSATPAGVATCCGQRPRAHGHLQAPRDGFSGAKHLHQVTPKSLFCC